MLPQDNAVNNVANSQSPNPSVSIFPTVTITATPSPTSSATISPAPNQGSTVTNIPINPFENSSFPQSACGDAIPAGNSSPISLYPVFVEYSDNNLQRIKAQFCQDALPKTRKGTNRQAVQIASTL